MRDNIYVMRIKSILSLIAFFTTFIFCVTLIGLPKNNFYSRFSDANYSAQNRQNVRNFLWADINRGRQRNIESSDDLVSLADSVESYVDEAQSSDDSNLPADLRAAWQQHMNAWREHSDFLNNVKASPDRLDSYDLGNNDLNLSDAEMQTYSNQSNEINRTWYEVLRVGRKYGAYVPVE